jgi:hypothetical protein
MLGTGSERQSRFENCFEMLHKISLQYTCVVQHVWAEIDPRLSRDEYFVNRLI